MAEQLKVIVLTTFISVFLTFTYVQFIQTHQYVSRATVLLPSRGGGNLGGLTGLASQFGVNVPTGAQADLSSPSLFPELVKTYTFLGRISDEKFYVSEFEKELTLLQILINESNELTLDKDELLISAMGAFQDMVQFSKAGAFSLLTVKAKEPLLARDINLRVLDELQKLNRYLKSQNVSEKISFIQSRISAVSRDLDKSEIKLKTFRENNRQISSPALLLEQDRLSRNADVQKGIFLTLKQQLELANIEKIQNETIIQVLDEPQVPLYSSGENLKIVIFLSLILGLGLGVIFGFIRAYINNDNMNERRKLRRVRNFIKKKSKDIILDYRVNWIMSIVLITGLPFYLSHQSKNPVFFGMYSMKLMVINTLYILTLILLLVQLIRIKQKRIKTKN